MSVNDLKVKLEVVGYEKLKKCADNVIEASIIMEEAIEELSGCMLEVKVSDPYVNENLVTEAVDMEDKTTLTTASETKEVFNAEEIIEDMILKLKENFNECLLKKEIPGAFDRAMIVSEEIRKLMECLTILKNTPEIGLFKWGAEGHINIQGNQSMQVIEPVECYEIESLDQILQVALELTIDLFKKDSKTYEDVFENIKKIEGKFKFTDEVLVNDLKTLLLKQAKKTIEQEVQQTEVYKK